MINDLISTINSNRGSDITECNKFLVFLKKDRKLNDETIRKESKKCFIKNKFLFKKVFKESNSVKDMSVLVASIYANIYTEFARNYGYKNLVAIKSNLYKLQYNSSSFELNSSFVNF